MCKNAKGDTRATPKMNIAAHVTSRILRHLMRRLTNDTAVCQPRPRAATGSGKASRGAVPPARASVGDRGAALAGVPDRRLHAWSIHGVGVHLHHYAGASCVAGTPSGR